MLLRPIALFLGCFSLLNLVLGWVIAGFDANIWWIDFRVLPAPLPDLALALAGATLVAYALFGVPRGRWRWLLAPGLVMVVVFAALNVVQFYVLLGSGAIATAIPVPLSLLILVPVAAMVGRMWRGPSGHERVRSWPRRGLAAAIFAATCLAFPLAQVLCFGHTDYRRPADAVVVFGARAYASGRMSTALSDRIATAVELYRTGLVRVVVVSGGPGDGDVHETEAMRRYAVENGVPAAAIVVDRDGLSTQHTVRNTVPMLRERGLDRVLAVSQFFHLPRIKLTYLRAGLEVYTVPAEVSQPLPATPYYVLREVAALWFYYLRPLLPGD